ncbi:type III effector protein (plasmid) [Ralstonia solanacearum]|uniref:Type III effector protein n=1 Tax=Ralstonia solanacearum TaxID=305 RepID=A0AAD0SBR0_RALSL|nr:type III effector protein [Ralstonia solanacearum]AXV84072.1 type III effector protein [Ralstonia solanacearum]AXW55202.1 type III effector protein [Ralstonia solanacearum]
MSRRQTMSRFLNCFFPTAHKPSASPVADTAAPTGSPELNPAAPPAQARPPRSARGTMKDRLKQLVHIKQVPQKPAISVDSWDEHATFKICEQWREGQTRQPSVPGLARLAALNFERAQAHSIPEDKKEQRLLPEGASEATYYQAMIETFLKTVGIEDKDVAATLESFKKAGTGGLHRQPVTISSTVGGAVSTAQYAASAHMPTKIALSGVQTLLTLLTTRLAFDSADLRFRNAGTEEVMPLGRADAAPGAKTGPNVLRASGRLAWDLRKISANVRKMEQAQAALEKAHAAYDAAQATIGTAQEALDTAETALAATQAVLDAPTKAKLFQHLQAVPDIAQAQKDVALATKTLQQGQQDAQQAQKDIQAAGEKLKIAFAKFCLRNELKSDYKTAAESAKIEYHGNKRFLGVSVATGAANLTATTLGIFTPVLVSATVTTGVTAAAAALAVVLYLGYQLSSGPSKDGEAKARRAIVALAKSLDLLAGNAAKQQKARAAAYRTYLAEKRIANKPEVRKQAKAKLIATLDEIARKDTTQNDLDPLKNWLDYVGHEEAVKAAGDDLEAVRNLEETFSQTHGAQFNTKTVAEAWKTPERMRFDSMGRLLLGKVSESFAAVHTFNAETERAAPSESKRQAYARRQIHAGKLADVKASLRDWIRFEQAQSQMKAALQEKDPDQARATLRGAAQALAAIRDPDAQALFSRDGRKQVEATELAKRMTIGERERYTITNAGPATLAAAVNITGAVASLGLNIDKAVAQSHGVTVPAQYGDQNDARTLAQGSAPVTAPYVAAERARFQKTRMAKTLQTLAREGDRVTLKLDLPAGRATALDAGDTDTDQALDNLIKQLEGLRDIPDELTLSVGGQKLASGKLDGTTSYQNWRYQDAPASTKAKFQMRKMGMVADNLAISVVTPFAQSVAQVPLSMTRAAVTRGNAMSVNVRDHLTRLAGQPAAARQPSIQRQPSAQPAPKAVHPTSPRKSSPPAQAQPAQRPPAPSRVPGKFAPFATRLALSDIPMLGGEAAADEAAAPTTAVFQPRPAGVAHAEAVAQQRDMLAGGQGAEAARQWFEARGIEAAHNSGATNMDCLIISLLQHASGQYGADAEPLLAEQAQHYRQELSRAHPEIMTGDRMLYDDEPAIQTLLQTLNEHYRVSMDLQLVLPTVDGPVRLPSRKTGDDPVGVVLFGNHFQALHKPLHAQGLQSASFNGNVGQTATQARSPAPGEAEPSPGAAVAKASPQPSAGAALHGTQGGTSDIEPAYEDSDDDFVSARLSLSDVEFDSEPEGDTPQAGRNASADADQPVHLEHPRPRAEAEKSASPQATASAMREQGQSAVGERHGNPSAGTTGGAPRAGRGGGVSSPEDIAHLKSLPQAVAHSQRAKKTGLFSKLLKREKKSKPQPAPQQTVAPANPPAPKTRK